MSRSNFNNFKRIRREENLVVIVSLLVFLYVCIYVLTQNIHGDGFVHMFYAKEIVKNQNLIDHQPYRILDIYKGRMKYFPISYPLTYHVFLSVLYLFGGTILLKISSAFFATLVVIVLYLLFRNVKWYLGLVGGFFGVILSSHRFIMVPLMEQYLIPSFFFAVLFIYEFYTKNKTRYAILSGFFIGLSIAIKQQGLVLSSSLILFVLISIIVRKKLNFRSSIKGLLVMFSAIALVSFLPLYDQIDRTGTIGYSPGETRLPNFIPLSTYIQKNILKSKFPIDKEGKEWLDKVIGYKLKELSISDTFRQYILFPAYYNRWMHYKDDINILIFFSILIISGISLLFKRSKLIFSLTLLIFLSEFTTTWFFKTRIHQYQQIGIITLSIFIVAGTTRITKQLKEYNKLLVPLFLMYLIVVLIVGWVTYIHNPLFKQEGRQSDEYIRLFKELGKFVKENTPKEAIFLAAETNFRYYAERNSIWVSNGGGGKIPLILNSKDPKIAIKWLKYYKVDYIFINLDQTKRKGVYDYIPNNGLLTYLDNSTNYFELVYAVPKEKPLLKLYKVKYKTQ
ncbi:MAG: hypothetical protein H0Z28_11875 [Archaeoglobus sp.]|nr:hypothetical protein [Archaeoglobus sp.]